MKKEIGLMMERLGVVPGDENKALALPCEPMYAEDNPCDAHRWSARKADNKDGYTPFCLVCGIKGEFI